MHRTYRVNGLFFYRNSYEYYFCRLNKLALMQRIIILLFLFCFKMFGENRAHFFVNNLHKETVLKTATKAKSLSIYYGTKNEGLNIQKYPFSKKIALPEFNNSFELDNLIPDTEYFFVVQSEDNELQQYSFKTGSLNKNLATTPSGNEDFTVIALPDTQHYTWRSNTFQIFIDQTQWVINQKVNLNIVLVDHLGDIVDYSEPVQWQRARLALDLLNQNDIAIGVAPGNHDYDAIDAYTGQGNLYDKNFPATTAISVADGLGIPSYEQYDWYGGYMGGTNDVVTSDDGVYTNRLWKNNYVLFSAGGMDFINIAMEFNFPFEAQQWLDDVLTAFPNRRAIISTHQFLRDNNTVTSSGNVQAVLNNILAEHCNVFLILCAHNHDGDTPGVAELNLQNSCGKPVYIRMSNYQEEENGGDGYLRIMKFHPSKSTIDVTTYSPVLNQYKTDAYNQFTLQYDMSASTPITFNITSPEDHSVFDIGTTNIPISINASSIVDFVEFKLNGQTFVDNTASNGVFSITTSGTTNWLPEGTYIVEVIAHDNETSTTLTKQISITIGTLSKTLDVRIASANNDAEEFVWNGSVNLTSSDLELYTDEGNAQQVGLRFQNITIPRGATITNAYVEFTVDELNSGTFSMKVAGEATDNSNVFNASQNNISNRTKTNAFVDWSPANWVAENDLHRTPNLSTIIQEITDRNGWNTGNSMSFIFYGNNNATSTRVAEAYDGETFSAPLLHVEYTLGNCQTRTFYADLDNDGYGDPNNIKIQCTLPTNYVENNLDCNDNNASVNPNAIEIAFNNIDDDCNPSTLDNPTGIELEITSPTNNYIFNQGTSSISISATTNSVVDYVEFKLNGQTFVDNNNADTTFSVNASGSSGWLPTGNYIIEVTAYDIETSNSLSKQLNITIGPIFGNVDTRVNGSTNDAEENLFNNGSIDLGSSDLELFTESGVDPQQIGLRFQNISIPKNATITNAYIEFTVDEVTSGNVTVNISGEATDNSLAFQNVAYNISARTKTSSTVAWNPTNWLNENDLHQTPNLKDLVQEIVNRTGWSSGNSMSFILYGGNVPTNTRVAESYDGENFSAPLLHIEYSIGACNLQTYYADNDHDGFGDANNSISDCTQPLNFVTNNTDCDDNNASVNASATEIPYNGIDDDCNPFTKDDDLDGDGFILANDCNDNNASVNASATEIPYNGIDDDCNPLTKDDDLDGDGFVLANDCDDNDASVNASAIEIPYNGIDDDCNPLTKDDDLDGDGFVLANDCDDNNASVNALATEIPYNGIDDDCNPLTKDDDLDGDGFVLANDCDDNNANKHELFSFYLDTDGDGIGSGNLISNICAVNATTPPLGYSLVNNDCEPDNSNLYRIGQFYVDIDGDNYSATLNLSTICYGSTIPSGYKATTLGIDCNDINPSINPAMAEILYDGIDNNCDGVLDAGFQLTTTMKDCGITLPTISTNISCVSSNAQGIDGYRFEITNTTSNQIQTIDRTVQYFSMTQLASYEYSKTYSIRVMLRKNGVWLGYYGPSCLFSTPAVNSSGGAGSLQIQNYCGQKLPIIGATISTTSLPGATGYKFRVINTLTGVTQTLVRSLQWFTMTQLPSYNYGTKYIIDVAVKTTGDYTAYGIPCEITTPDVPSLVNFCNTTVPTKGTSITTTSLPNVTAYRFEITRYTNSTMTNVVSVFELDRSVNWFTLNMLTNYSPNTYYGVRIKVMSSGSWSPWGNQCYIISPATSRMNQQSTVLKDIFNAKVYPNPSENEFNLNVESSSNSDVIIRVYDSFGKLIEDRIVPLIEVPNVTLGSRYSSGVYNIIISQDDEMRFVKLIKK